MVCVSALGKPGYRLARSISNNSVRHGAGEAWSGTTHVIHARKPMSKTVHKPMTWYNVQRLILVYFSSLWGTKWSWGMVPQPDKARWRNAWEAVCC